MFASSVRRLWQTARATTNRFDDESLKRVCRPRRGWRGCSSPIRICFRWPCREEAKGGKAPSRYFDDTAALTPADRADAVGRLWPLQRRHKLTTAGIFFQLKLRRASFNSRGLTANHRQTSAEISITMLAADSSGWQKANSPDVAKLDPLPLARNRRRKGGQFAPSPRNCRRENTL